MIDRSKRMDGIPTKFFNVGERIVGGLVADKRSSAWSEVDIRREEDEGHGCEFSSRKIAYLVSPRLVHNVQHLESV